jgi:hypothetical protein
MKALHTHDVSETDADAVRETGPRRIWGKAEMGQRESSIDQRAVVEKGSTRGAVGSQEGIAGITSSTVISFVVSLTIG